MNNKYSSGPYKISDDLVVKLTKRVSFKNFGSFMNKKVNSKEDNEGMLKSDDLYLNNKICKLKLSKIKTNFVKHICNIFYDEEYNNINTSDS